MKKLFFSCIALVLISTVQAQNVGIGTTTPTTKLHVIGTTKTDTLLVTRNAIISEGIMSSISAGWISGNFGVAATGDRVVMGNLYNTATIGANNNALNAWANLSINPDGGNVGIGTTQPAAQLHVAGTNLGDTARGSIIMSRYWLNATDTRASAIYHLASTANAKDKLVLGVSGEGGSYSSPLLLSNAKMVIQADGNVGIGTNTPVNKLSVAGNANFTGNVVIGATTPIVSAALDISSTTKGFLPPRMTNVQRDAIPGAVAGLIVWCSNCGTTGELQVYNGTAWTNMVGNPTTPPAVPTVITTAISGITATSGVSGGNVTTDGGSPVTARGVCWDIATNPTVALATKTNNGTGTGIFVSNITGLTFGITYYVRAYATSAIGTAYGLEFSFIAAPGIGESFQGGIVAYILQPGDPGYNVNVPHGLIAAPSDQGTNVNWGCEGTTIPGADGTDLGTGNQNTIDILAGCAAPSIAAKICGDLVLNGYSDWFLPSFNELNKLYINRAAVGGFVNNYYWSSTEFNHLYAWDQLFGSGSQVYGFKTNLLRVRAVRAF